MKPADRLGQLKPYFFATLNNSINLLRSQGVDVIRLDIGSPDLPPADFIIQALVEAAQEKDVHGYAAYGGTKLFREAICTYYETRFGVRLDPYEEVVGLIGSKEGVFNLSQALLNPGDVVLLPDPSYPTYAAGAEIAGAEIYYIPIRKKFGFKPVLEEIPGEVLGRAKILWLNFPNNPTGATVDYEYFENVIEFASQHNLLVLHDAPYLDINFDGYRAPSILEIPGAKDVAVEFNSLSKTYNMAGWRLGMAVGNAAVLRFLYLLKLKIDTSNFSPLQTAGARALTGDQTWVQEKNVIYQQRRDRVLKGFHGTPFEAIKPNAGMYIWIQLPVGVNEGTFCEQLVSETGVSMTPGTVFGPGGSGFVRISLCTPLAQIEEALDRFSVWVQRKEWNGK
jgi:LL-diaminopimelate aminotransferase